MKKLVKQLPLVAFVFALVAAFAFNMPSANDLQWFELDDEGNIGDYMDNENPCPGGAENCSVGLSESDLDESGEPLYDNISEVPGTVPIGYRN